MFITVHRKSIDAKVFHKTDTNGTWLIGGFFNGKLLIYTILGGLVALRELSLHQLLWIKKASENKNDTLNITPKLDLDVDFPSLSFHYNLIHSQTWPVAV